MNYESKRIEKCVRAVDDDTQIGFCISDNLPEFEGEEKDYRLYSIETIIEDKMIFHFRAYYPR